MPEGRGRGEGRAFSLAADRMRQGERHEASCLRLTRTSHDSLRVVLLTVLIGLTTLTVGVIGVVAYLDARDTSTDLTQKILGETSKRVTGWRLQERIHITRRG